MDFNLIVMWLGFGLAAYSVVGNDVIQTLGTFLTSNEKSFPWWVLYIFAASILSFALIQGYMMEDISYGRLDKYHSTLATLDYKWYYLLPPIVLLMITRSGIPVSTTFMILTLFSLSGIPNDIGPMVSSVFDSSTKLGGMIQKSILGYIVAFTSAIVIYLIISKLTEQYFLKNELKSSRRYIWIVLQWLSTGFLWYQWLTQDLANIYVYLRGGNDLPLISFLITLFIFLGLLAYIFYLRGGAVQNVVRSKTNTADIRSATFIDFIYGVILYVFKYDSIMGFDYQFPWTGNLPMSTTWVFIGLLAGREIGMRIIVDNRKLSKDTMKMIFSDLMKVFFGLLVSVLLVFIIKILAT